MRVEEMVITLLDRLQHVDPSVDWRGQMNWEKLGSQIHCWRCGGEFGKDIEPGSHVWHHIIPSSEGGPDTIDNRSLLCGDCHNVVHRFYLPTGRIGKKRTRDGKWRRVVRFEEGIELSQDIPAADGSLSSCRKCESRGIVDGVSEGYWDGDGMMVFLTCSKCEHGFAVPFIGTNNGEHYPFVTNRRFCCLPTWFEKACWKVSFTIAHRNLSIPLAFSLSHQAPLRFNRAWQIHLLADSIPPLPRG